MIMNTKQVIKFIGSIAFAAGVVANLQYAWNDYGVLTNSLHVEVLAQSASGSGGETGGGTTGGGYGDPIYEKKTSDCKYEGKATRGSVIKLGDSITIEVGRSGEWEYIAHDADVRCEAGGKELCIPQNCPPYQGLTT